MCGVDLVDQKRDYYTMQTASHKWWHRVFLFIVDSSLNNGFCLYEEDLRALGLPLIAHQLWHYKLGEALVQPFITADNIQGAVRNLVPRGLHRVDGHLTTQGRCCVCQA
jgi:hypothetical protein